MGGTKVEIQDSSQQKQEINQVKRKGKREHSPDGNGILFFGDGSGERKKRYSGQRVVKVKRKNKLVAPKIFYHLNNFQSDFIRNFR